MIQEKGFTPLETAEQPASNKRFLSGFTLLEVMISALLIMVGLGALGVTVVAGKRFLKQAEYRSQALGLASNKMEELLARAYAFFPVDIQESNQTGSYNWNASVVTRNASGPRAIPYKDIVVVVSYPEEDGGGVGLDTNNIRLTNIIPYPTAHTASKKIPTDTIDDEVPFDDYETIGNATVRLELIRAGLKFAVPKDIVVSYSVGVGINSTDEGAEIAPIDTIYSACFYSNGTITDKLIGVETRTPIATQASFNNKVVLKNMSVSNDNKIEIKWRYDRSTIATGYANTSIILRNAELSILATEAE